MSKEYTYSNKETGQEEVIKLEPWGWGVVYKDGTELHQFGANGDFHRVGEIDQDNVALWVLYRTDDMSKRIDIVLPPGAKVIHKYRNVSPHYLPFNTFVKVYMFGYKTAEGTYHYNFVLPDDRIVQSTTDDIDLVNFALTERKA